MKTMTIGQILAKTAAFSLLLAGCAADVAPEPGDSPDGLELDGHAAASAQTEAGSDRAPAMGPGCDTWELGPVAVGTGVGAVCAALEDDSLVSLDGVACEHVLHEGGIGESPECEQYRAVISLQSGSSCDPG